MTKINISVQFSAAFRRTTATAIFSAEKADSVNSKYQKSDYQMQNQINPTFSRKLQSKPNFPDGDVRVFAQEFNQIFSEVSSKSTPVQVP